MKNEKIKVTVDEYNKEMDAYVETIDKTKTIDEAFNELLEHASKFEVI